MSVSLRYIAAVSVLSALSGVAVQAGDYSKGGDQNGVIDIPKGQGPTGGCCGSATGHMPGFPGVNVPAPNVNITTGGAKIGSTHINVGGSSFISNSSTVFGGRSGGNVFVGGGSSYISSPSPVSPGVIEGLNVAGNVQQAVTEQFQENRIITESLAIRAVCMDDRGTPHPASRIDGEPNIAATFDGEVFRCMAGTRMDVIIGKVVDGRAVFDGGRTISCQKGQALSYSPAPASGTTTGGNLKCVTQAVRAECNERSLLRRFGPGIKYATITRTETVTNTRQVAKSNEVTLRSSMFIDGGVGQGVY